VVKDGAPSTECVLTHPHVGRCHPRPNYANAVREAFDAWVSRDLEQDDGDDAELITLRTVRPKDFRLIDSAAGHVWKWEEGRWVFAGLAMQAENVTATPHTEEEG